jgi:hypothetical protein
MVNGSTGIQLPVVGLVTNNMMYLLGLNIPIANKTRSLFNG